jgi:hypothetical protein
MREQIRLDLSNRVLRGKDIFLCHTGADKAWALLCKLALPAPRAYCIH